MAKIYQLWFYMLINYYQNSFTGTTTTTSWPYRSRSVIHLNEANH